MKKDIKGFKKGFNKVMGAIRDERLKAVRDEDQKEIVSDLHAGIIQSLRTKAFLMILKMNA